MRSALRLLQPLEAPSRRLPKSGYICSTCRQEILPRVIQGVQFRRNASENTPFTEKVRRRIWGTDSPPGLKDPYGGEGVIAKTFRKRGQGQAEGEQALESEPEAQVEREGEIADDIAPQVEYTPASTWDGIERVGHLERWIDYSPTEADGYVG
jgi:hypothetical protein